MAPRMTLTKAVQSGDQRKALTALRDELARAVEAADAEKKAPLARQLTIVLDRLAALPTEGVKSTVDQLARKRAARRAKAKVVDAPARGGDKRRGRSG